MKPVPLSRLLSLAGRQLFRESRSGELRVLFFALLIAVASSTAIGYFSARLNGAMLARAAEFLGADLVLNGTQPASAEQIERGTRLGLRHADSVEFSSVIATDQGIQLSSIKAVGDRYPQPSYGRSTISACFARKTTPRACATAHSVAGRCAGKIQTSVSRRNNPPLPLCHAGYDRPPGSRGFPGLEEKSRSWHGSCARDSEAVLPEGFGRWLAGRAPRPHQPEMRTT